MIELGDFKLHAISDGFFRLDGGAMFGIVPKPVWQKVTEVDDRNRIQLSLTTLLIQTGKHNVLVDTGIGTKHDEKFNKLYAVDHFTTVPESLKEVGLTVDDIDTVIISHLHFDHAGGATVRTEDREVVPTFPNARYVIQKGMWNEAIEPNARTMGSYHKDDFFPLQEAGVVDFMEGDGEVVPGVRVVISGGHVKNHQVIFAESGGKTAIYWADLLPTTNHIKPAWVMGYDLFPHETTAIKSKWLERAIQEDWVNVFEHDPNVAMGKIRWQDRKFRLDPLEEVAKPRS